jgi:hypothetical protein
MVVRTKNLFTHILFYSVLYLLFVDFVGLFSSLLVCMKRHMKQQPQSLQQIYFSFKKNISLQQRSGAVVFSLLPLGFSRVQPAGDVRRPRWLPCSFFHRP